MKILPELNITNEISKINNFDLVRLFAALQVVLGHSASHFDVKLPTIFRVLNYFPGVPIFFGVSGFLITSAFCRNQDFRKYMRNRIFRVYPALWVCFFITILLLIIFNVLSIKNMGTMVFFKWVLCQISFFQFYTPDFLRPWGVGTPNGSLWTIAVELQFYLFLPFLVFFKQKFSKLFVYVFFSILFFASIGIGLFYTEMNVDNIYTKLAHVSLGPYFHYFILGVVSFLLWDRIKFLFEGKFILWLIVYISYIIIFSVVLELYETSYYPSFFGWISNALLWCLILATAFTNVTFADRLLNKNDISYGLYIYHMLVINSLISLNLNNIVGYAKMLIVIIVTCTMAFFSWKFVEYPILKKK